MFTSFLKTVVLAAVSVVLGGCWDTGGGEKIGTITRLNKQGVFCKTWEGEIIRGGLNGGSGVMGQAFHFTIEDERLASEVQKALDTQQEVKITYRREFITFCRSDSTEEGMKIFLTKIEPLHVVAVPPTPTKDVTIAPAKPIDVTQELLLQNRAMIANQAAMLEEMRKQRESLQGSGKK